MARRRSANKSGTLRILRKNHASCRTFAAFARFEGGREQLNEMIPLSVAHWHAHVNICLPNGITLNDLLRGDVGTSQVDMPGMIPVASNPAAVQINQRLGFLADGRFGFHGKIADAAACESAGGHFIPQAFGWMVHVYPFNGDDLKVAFGTSVPTPPAN